MRKKVVLKTLTLLLCGFLCIDAFAQEKTITGVVSDQNGSPLAGATVSEKGVKNSVTSTASGIFKITVPAKTKALVISYVGMKSQEISIEGKTSVAISLNVADNSLNEVVVIGYGSTKRADVTSSIASISEKDIKNLPVSGADQALQGKLAGVTVNSNGGQPGGGV